MKKLCLKKESLSELAPADLESVVAGTVTYGCTVTKNTLCITELLRKTTVPTSECTQVTW